MVNDRKELDDEMIELRKKIRDTESQNGEKLLSYQSSTEQKLRDIEIGNKKSLKEIHDKFNNLKEELNRQFTTHKIDISNMTKKQNAEEFVAYRESLAILERSIKENSSIIQRYSQDQIKGMRMQDERQAKFDKKREELEKKIAAMQEKFDDEIWKSKANFEDHVAKERKKENDILKTLQEVSELQNDLKLDLEEMQNKLGENSKVQEIKEFAVKEVPVARKRTEELKSKTRAMDKEVKDKLSVVEQKLETLEEAIAETKDQLNQQAKKCNNSETNFKSSIDKVVKNCENIESELEDTKTRVDELEKSIADKPEHKSEIGEASLQQLKESQNELTASVKLLEGRHNVLREDAYDKFVECAKQFELIENELNRLSQQPKSVPKASVGINVGIKERQFNTVLVGTDKVVSEIEVQTEAKPPKEMPVVKKETSIIRKDRVEPLVRRSSEIYSKSQNIESEHMSEEDNQEPVLNQLVKKSQNKTVISERPVKRQLEDIKSYPSVDYLSAMEYNSPYKAQTTYEDAKQQTIDLEEIKERKKVARSSTSNKDPLSSSPHYLREDPILSKDKQKIASTQSPTVEENLSAKYFKKKFNMDINDLPDVGPKEPRLATHSETFDYRSIDFERYRPQAESDEMNSEKSGGRNRSTHIGRLLEPLKEVEESPKDHKKPPSSEHSLRDQQENYEKDNKDVEGVEPEDGKDVKNKDGEEGMNDNEEERNDQDEEDKDNDLMNHLADYYAQGSGLEDFKKEDNPTPKNEEATNEQKEEVSTDKKESEEADLKKGMAEAIILDDELYSNQESII